MPSLLATAASLLLLPPALVHGMYAKSGPVLQLDGPSYDSLIAQSNHTSIVEFYAPWCGHCKNLKPAYEKAATALQGLAKVAAVDCDAEENKSFCGRMGVQGFPTLKIVKPGKKPGRPIVEDYQGARTAKAIVEAVKEKIPNRVSRLNDGDYEAWLSKDDAPKAILFSDKGVTGPLLKALAIDFQGSINVAQIRNKEKKAVEQFKATKFPALVLIPGNGKEPILYDGEMKKDPMVKFLSQAASPNPDPAPKEKKAKKEKKSKTNKPAAPKASKPAAHPGAEDGDPAECPYKGDKGETNDAKEPVKPATPEPAPLIASLADEVSLQQKCLNTKAGVCILALHPAEASTNPLTSDIVTALSEIQHKHSQKRKLFPFFQLPASNPSNAALRSTLDLVSPKDEISLIATNGKKAWFRAYPAKTWSHDEIEAWIDGLRMGDSTTPKQTLTESLLADPASLPAETKEEDQKQKQDQKKPNLNLNMENDDLSRAEAEDLICQLLPNGESIDLDSLDPDTYSKIMAAGKSFKAEMKEQGSIPSRHSSKEDVEDEEEEQGHDEGHDEL
ncbi:putative disulfide isomerase [Acrodontium crateriforme]|uniref:protein disulfide-isomerase n=1 Tax=Acrodontium crateriforme TaxID=150365 RepID=A0AAQ3M4V2_9PEZI|nr:putative disulfide isomerase [Acrodontium crateriforme]